MKRHNAGGRNDFGGGMGGNKRPRADPYNEALEQGKFELRVLIPTKSAGAVIGKGGEYIKSVRDKFDATLTVPDRGTPERVFTITVSLEGIKDCFAEILNKLAEEQRRENRNDLDIRMLVHQSHAGAIIGRGGAKIKELRDETKSNIKVYQACCPASTDRVVQITTDQSNMPNVVQTLIDFMRDIPIKGVQKPYDATYYDPHLAFEYGGYISDRPDRYRGHGPGGPPMGPPPYGGGYGDYGPPPRGGRGGPPPPRGGYGGPPGGPGGYGGPDLYADPYGGGAVQTTQVTIPNELGGTIIGKGGERINRIRADSGAKIDVGQPYGNDERIITITGTQPQIQHAQYLLQQTVIRYGPKDQASPFQQSGQPGAPQTAQGALPAAQGQSPSQPQPSGPPKSLFSTTPNPPSQQAYGAPPQQGGWGAPAQQYGSYGGGQAYGGGQYGGQGQY